MSDRSHPWNMLHQLLLVSSSIRIQWNQILMRSNQKLGPSINGLVTDGNTKLCCRVFVLALFHSTTAYKIDSEHTQGYTKLIPV